MSLNHFSLAQRVSILLTGTFDGFLTVFLPHINILQFCCNIKMPHSGVWCGVCASSGVIYFYDISFYSLFDSSVVFILKKELCMMGHPILYFK